MDCDVVQLVLSIYLNPRPRLGAPSPALRQYAASLEIASSQKPTARSSFDRARKFQLSGRISCFLDCQRKHDATRAWSYFEHAKAQGRQLKYWQLTSDATRDQLNMLPQLPGVPHGTPHQHQFCDVVLREAERHQDIYLLATGNHLRAFFMMKQGTTGAKVYLKRSKDCWLDLMKAASLQGEAGNPALMVASSNLVKSVVNVAVGKSWVKYQQADKMLKEAQQYADLNGD
ncbi:hypothetical protein WJX77_000063 [Trebouxia sp. C0004]